MGLILWIDENAFATSLIEKACKKKGQAFYSVSNVIDFAYLVTDLRPSVIVVDALTALGNLERFKAQYEETQHFNSLPVIVLGSGLEFLKPRGELKRPIDPFKVTEEIQKILSNH